MNEMRMKFEPNEEEKAVKALLDRLTVAVHELTMWRQVRDSVDGRGLSIAITHIETARLWIKEATKVEDDGA